MRALIGDDLIGPGPTEHVADLEQSDCRVAMAGVVAERPQHAREQRRPQDRLLLHHRVGHTDRVRRKGAAFEVGRADQRGRPDLLGSGGGKLGPDSAGIALICGERTDEIGPEGPPLDVVVAEHAPDLFDDVDLRCRVRPPARDGDVPLPWHIRRRADESDRRDQRRDGIVGERGAEDPIHPRRTDPHDLGGGRYGTDVIEALDREPRARLQEDLDHPRRSAREQLGVGAALEAGRRLAAQAHPLRGAGDAHRRPVCDFEEEAGGVLVDLGRRPAHHGGDANNGVLAIDDHAVLRVAQRKCPLDLVERGELLAGGCPAHADAPARKLVEVERVARRAELEHHVVGRIDDVVDRSHAGRGEACPHDGG